MFLKVCCVVCRIVTISAYVLLLRRRVWGTLSKALPKSSTCSSIILELCSLWIHWHLASRFTSLLDLGVFFCKCQILDGHHGNLNRLLLGPSNTVFTVFLNGMYLVSWSLDGLIYTHWCHNISIIPLDTMWTNHTSDYLPGGLGGCRYITIFFIEKTHFVNFCGLT